MAQSSIGTPAWNVSSTILLLFFAHILTTTAFAATGATDFCVTRGGSAAVADRPAAANDTTVVPSILQLSDPAKVSY